MILALETATSGVLGGAVRRRRLRRRPACRPRRPRALAAPAAVRARGARGGRRRLGGRRDDRGRPRPRRVHRSAHRHRHRAGARAGGRRGRPGRRPDARRRGARARGRAGGGRPQARAAHRRPPPRGVRGRLRAGGRRAPPGRGRRRRALRTTSAPGSPRAATCSPAATAPCCTRTCCRRRRGGPRQSSPRRPPWWAGRSPAARPASSTVQTPCCLCTAARPTLSRARPVPAPPIHDRRRPGMNLQVVHDTPRRERSIRPMHFTDLEAVAALEARTFTLPWSLAIFNGQLARDTGICLVCEDGGRIVGYLIADMFVDVWHLMNLCVSEEAASRARGLRSARGVLRDHGAQGAPRAHPRGARVQRAGHRAVPELRVRLHRRPPRLLQRRPRGRGHHVEGLGRATPHERPVRPTASSSPSRRRATTRARRSCAAARSSRRSSRPRTSCTRSSAAWCRRWPRAATRSSSTRWSLRR